MKHSELPITLWNGPFLDGKLTIQSHTILEDHEPEDSIRDVMVVLIPQSNDMSYTASTKISNTRDSVLELLNTIMYEYKDLVQEFKNRELANGSICLH